MRRLLPYVLPAAACVVLALVLTAVTPRPPRGTLGSSSPAPDLVDSKELTHFPGHGPRRAVLEWWRAEQEGNARAGYALLSASLRARIDPMSYDRKLRRATLGFVGKLYVTGAVHHGAHATVQAVAVAFGPMGPGLAYPLSFPLVRERNRWRLGSIAYLNLNDRDRTAAASPAAKRSVPRAAKKGA